MRTGSRLLWSSVAIAALGVLATARWLTPSATGLGTHVALGLPPCGFWLWSGLPCPACGLTTSFAALAHGQLAPALMANPLGLPLFVLTLLLVPLSVLHARRGSSLALVIDRYQADRVALWVVLGLLLGWAARLAALSLR